MVDSPPNQVTFLLIHSQLLARRAAFALPQALEDLGQRWGILGPQWLVISYLTIPLNGWWFQASNGLTLSRHLFKLDDKTIDQKINWWANASCCFLKLKTLKSQGHHSGTPEIHAAGALPAPEASHWAAMAPHNPKGLVAWRKSYFSMWWMMVDNVQWVLALCWCKPNK